MLHAVFVIIFVSNFITRQWAFAGLILPRRSFDLSHSCDCGMSPDQTTTAAESGGNHHEPIATNYFPDEVKYCFRILSFKSSVYFGVNFLT